jgi:WD40 repeat protein/serine/threonine protein kinase
LRSIESQFVEREDHQPGPLTGRTLGDFVVEGKLGEGGFGDVYIASQPVLAREAVIKTLKWETGGAAETVQRFLREARVASSLDHPFSAHIYAFGAETDGTLWIAMERVKGSTLADLVATGGPLPLSRLVPLMERICEVVHTAHEHGIVHRDIKPHNIMVVSRAGRLLPKLLDFGVAKALGGDVLDLAPSGARSPSEPPAFGTGTPRDGAGGHTGVFDGTLGAVLSRAGIDASHAKVQTGRVMLGSPRYMAPEQWFDPRTIDRRADIYALGAVFYEALTGKPAFTGDSVRAIAKAHARAPVPTVPSELPPALDGVLAKAMAKTARDRYATAIEFAEALRAASGEPDVDLQLPVIDETLRDAVLSTAPQPIADAVAAYEAAVTAERAARAARGIAHAVVRYVGAIAIAARASTGGLPHAPALAALIARWRKGGLDTAGWIELTRQACEDFLTRPDLFPIPEIPLLFAPDRARPAALHELVGVDADPAGPASPSQADLAASVAIVERVLGELRFLSDYPLVADLDGGPRSWMGARRRRRPVARLAPHASIEPAEPVILDGQGVPIIRLFPLIQIAAPSPGADDELFVLERGHRLGAVLVAQPVGFERRDDRAWSFFGALAGGADAGAGEIAERSPYRGLSSFSTADADWYFGREREAEAFANRLREHAFIAVVGPSGVGKSSFVKAGVLPRLADPLAIVFRPGDRPIAALAAALAGPLGRPVDDAALAAPGALRDLARELAGTAGRAVAIVVDQFEELVTLCRDADERARFGALLVEAGASIDVPVRVVITLRDDFLVRAEEVPTLRHKLGRSLQLLTTPAAADLVRILVEPARKAGYAFDDPELPARIVEDVEARPGALALLSFTALRLWELRDERYRQLKRASYEAMGGVGGALAGHAEETLAALPPADAPLVREAFRHLVTADGTRAVLSKTELSQVLGGGERAAATAKPEPPDDGSAGPPSAAERADAVIQRLIGARLLASSEGIDGEDRVEVVHEALLSAWPRLVEWRREDAETARMRDQLRAGARQWDDRGRGRGLLWRGDELVELTLWRRRYPGKLTEREEEFVAASIADAARGRRIRRAIIAGSVAVLLAASAVLLVLYRASQRNRLAAEVSKAEASQRVVDLLVEQGRAAVVDDRPLEALVYLDAAHARGASGATLDYLVGRAVDTLSLQRASLEGHKTRVASGALSTDGTLFATGGGFIDKKVRIWDVASGTLVRERDVPSAVRRLEFRPGTTELLVSAGPMVALWDAATGTPRYEIALDPSTRTSQASISPDGARVIVLGTGSPAQLHDGRTGALIRVLPAGKAVSSTMSARGTLVAVANADDDVVVFSTDDGAERARMNLGVGVGRVAISPDDRYVIAGNLLGPARIGVWDRNGTAVATLTGHRAEIIDLAVSADGSQLLTASEDGTGRLWNLPDGRLIASFEGHRGPVNGVAFDPGGRYVATASADGTAKLWLRADGTLVTTLHGHSDGLIGLAISTDGAMVATWSVDMSAKLWAVRIPALVDEQAIATAGTGSVTRLADGSVIAVATDGTVALHAASGSAAVTLAPAPPAAPVHAFDVPYLENRRVASLAADGSTVAVPVGAEVAVWDRATGALRGRCGGHTAPVMAARHVPGGKLITSDEHGGMRVCDLAALSSTELAPEPHTDAVTDVELDPGGTAIVSAGFDRRAVVWRLDGSVERELTGHTNGIAAARFSPDGQRVVTASLDTTVRVWDRTTGAIVTILKTPTQLASVAVDDDVVVAGAGDGRLFVWETRTWRLIAVLGVRDATVDWLELRGGMLYASDAKGRLRTWRIARARGLDRLGDYVRCRVPYELVDNQAQLRPADADRPCAGVDGSLLLGR